MRRLHLFFSTARRVSLSARPPRPRARTVVDAPVGDQDGAPLVQALAVHFDHHVAEDYPFLMRVTGHQHLHHRRLLAARKPPESEPSPSSVSSAGSCPATHGLRRVRAGARPGGGSPASPGRRRRPARRRGRGGHPAEGGPWATRAILLRMPVGGGHPARSGGVGRGRGRAGAAGAHLALHPEVVLRVGHGGGRWRAGPRRGAEEDGNEKEELALAAGLLATFFFAKRATNSSGLPGSGWEEEETGASSRPPCSRIAQASRARSRQCLPSFATTRSDEGGGAPLSFFAQCGCLAGGAGWCWLLGGIDG